MKQIITKKNLNQSLDFLTDINFDEEDYERIYEKFKIILEIPEIKKILKNVSGINEIETEGDFKNILKYLIEKINVKDLNEILKKIIKNETLIDYIQDLFLEKLL